METKKQPDGIQAGSPLSEFQAVVETLVSLREQGRHFLFLTAPYSLKLVGDFDKLRLDLSKKLGKDTLTRREADRYLDEVLTFAQVSLWSRSEQQAVRALEEKVFKDEVRRAKDQSAEVRRIIGSKVACVATRLITWSLRERSKRLSQMVGPRLSDLEIELMFRALSDPRSMNLREIQAEAITGLLHQAGHCAFSNPLAWSVDDSWISAAGPESALSDAGGAASADAENDLRLENERLRTELIEKRREVLLLRQELDRANSLQGRLVDSVCNLTVGNNAAVQALAAEREGRMCLSETLEGVVSRVLGEDIEITYETEDGPLKQVYAMAQFARGKAPAEGETVRTFAFIAAGMTAETPAPEPSRGPAAENEDFRNWAESRPLIVD